MPYKVIISGSRSYADFEELTRVLDKFLVGKGDVEIIVGGAKGAEASGEKYANMRDLPLRKFFPEWSKLGKSAGLRRNEVRGLEADACVCFWDGGSTGTAHMFQVAKQNSILLHVVQYS